MKILFIFGTRPEAIKLAPLIKEMGKNKSSKSIICVTAQHRGMLDQVLKIFRIKPDHDLNVMEKDQDLFGIAAKCMHGLRGVFEKVAPDLVIVQGDTTTAFVAGLAAYYARIPIAHVEAGLRTYNKYSPFPEEANRRLLSVIADYNFAPTGWARDNLLKENISRNKIWVTGNTGIDALLMIKEMQKSNGSERKYLDFFKKKLPGLDLRGGYKKIILVTGHRRENFGEGFKNICMALKEISEKRDDVIIVYPVHLNPNVHRPVRTILNNKPNIRLIDPLDYDSFVFLMRKSYLILTDSGGIQEEAPALGKPVLLMRETTERPEGINAGTVKMVGANKDRIVGETLRLLDDSASYKKMRSAVNPYGDGKSARKIAQILIRHGHK